jgi:hypothetical protein
MKEFKRNLNFLMSEYNILKERMEMTLNGTRKRQVCEWWLSFIESETDSFLVQMGYVHNSLPFLYTTQPPDDLQIVVRNKLLLEGVMRANCNELEELLTRITTEVYNVMDELIDDTRMTLELKKGVVPEELYDRHYSSLEKDMQYLLQMKAMDEEITKRRCLGQTSKLGEMQLTNVVPVGGLVMARFHVLLCELKTAIEIWSNKKKKKDLEIMLSSIGEIEVEMDESLFENFTGGYNRGKNEKIPRQISKAVLSTCPEGTPIFCCQIALKQRRTSHKHLSKYVE